MQPRQQRTAQSHGAQPARHGGASGCAKDFVRNKSPVKVRVVRNKNRSRNFLQQQGRVRIKWREVLHHFPGNAGERGDVLGNVASWIHQRVEHRGDRAAAAVNTVCRDFGDSVSPNGAYAGGLDIHYEVAEAVQSGTRFDEPDLFMIESPRSVGGARKLRGGSEEREGNVVGYWRGGARHAANDFHESRGRKRTVGEY